MDDVTIVIAQHNRLELTRGCLDSVLTHETAAWRAVVVDDGSTAVVTGSVRHSDRVQTVMQPHRGVTAAWNTGARAARDGWLVFLNNDVQCSGPWIERLLAPLRSGQAVMTGAALREEQAVPADVLARTGRSFLTGWCMSVHRDVWERAGGFDERFRMYFPIPICKRDCEPKERWSTWLV